jgi:hypothetical protein
MIPGRNKGSITALIGSRGPTAADIPLSKWKIVVSGF